LEVCIEFLDQKILIFKNKIKINITDDMTWSCSNYLESPWKEMADSIPEFLIDFHIEKESHLSPSQIIFPLCSK
jgi:hypothetical protein